MSSKVTVLFAGASMSGKSSTISFHRNKYANSQGGTAEERFTQVERHNKRPLTVELLDTGGQVEFYGEIADWFSESHACVLFCNVDDEKSLDYLRDLPVNIKAAAKRPGKVFLAANSTSGAVVRTKAQVAIRNQALNLVQIAFPDLACPFVEIETTTGSNVSALFALLVQCLLGDVPEEPDVAFPPAGESPETPKCESLSMELRPTDLFATKHKDAAHEHVDVVEASSGSDARKLAAAEVSKAVSVVDAASSGLFTPVKEPREPLVENLRDFLRTTLESMQKELERLQVQLAEEQRERAAWMEKRERDNASWKARLQSDLGAFQSVPSYLARSMKPAPVNAAFAS